MKPFKPKKTKAPSKGAFSKKTPRREEKPVTEAEKPSKPRVILLNKPYLTLSQFTDSEGRDTLSKYVPFKDLYAAGRLDYDSEGLLVLSNFGPLQSWITDPRYKLSKTYLVQVEGIPTQEALAKLQKGVMLADGMTLPAQAKLLPAEPSIAPRNPPIRDRKNIPTSWIELTISEGRNRQVRRMTAAVGYPTLRLIRQRVGPWEIGKLEIGKFKEVPCPETKDELRQWTELFFKKQTQSKVNPKETPSVKPPKKKAQSINMLDSDDLWDDNEL